MNLNRKNQPNRLHLLRSQMKMIRGYSTHQKHPEQYPNPKPGARDNTRL